MIHSNFDWSKPLNWAIVAALVALLVVQIWFLIRNQTQSGVRRSLRVALNILLWLLIVGYVLQPVWQTTTPSTRALLVGEEVPADKAREVQARLGVSERFTARNFTGNFANVTLLGETFSPELLSRLSGSNVQWIPYEEPDQLESIHWKGLVRQGEMQRVSGRIRLSRKQWLKLSYAGQTLDSITLTPNDRSFALQFPAFARGRTELELTLGGTPLDTVRFFARPAEPMAYQFILNNPDFETKTLADWLGRMGQAVQLTSTVSTNIRNSVTINQSKERKPDMVITDPGNAANPIVKRAMLEGKRVLFINLINPDADVRTINQALGSRFSVRKIGNTETVPVGKDLTALPFQFNTLLSQQGVPGYPVAVQRTSGLVGISLLSETFPLALSGDSTGYARLWYALLSSFQKAGRNNVLIDAPVVSGLRRPIRVNNATGNAALMRVDTDTARLIPSPINPLSAEGEYRFNRAGWVPVADSLSLFVNTTQGSSVAKNQLVRSYVLAHEASFVSSHTETTPQPVESAITEWVWFVLLIGCFTALWAEPKLG